MSLEDKAQEHEAMIWQRNNTVRETRTYAPSEPGYGPEECDHCGAEMHPLRRSNGWRLCTPCQSAIEIATQRR